MQTPTESLDEVTANQVRSASYIFWEGRALFVAACSRFPTGFWLPHSLLILETGCVHVPASYQDLV